MNKPQNILVFLIVITFLSCNRNLKKEVAEVQKDSIVTIEKDISLDTDEIKLNDLKIFTLSNSYIEDNNIKEGVGFISLSDYFGYSNHPDSLVIPKQYLRNIHLNHKANYLEIKESYRANFLNFNHTKETDSIFIFNCDLDSIFSFPIKEVSIVAFLHYFFEATNPVTEADFCIGFELNKKQLGVLGKESFDRPNFVYIGKSNPFVKGEVKPVLWQKVNNDLFPKNAKPFKYEGYENYPKRIGSTFKFESNGLFYFVQTKILTDKRESRDFEIGHFVVVNSENQAIVYDNIQSIKYTNNEVDLLSMDDIINATKSSRYYHWTGAIFKNKPPIIYFNNNPLYECESIYFLDSKEPHIVIGCDNRN